MTVGDNPLRKEGTGKLDGTAQYVDDIVLDGMLFGRTLRSSLERLVQRPAIQFSDPAPAAHVKIARGDSDDAANAVPEEPNGVSPESREAVWQ